VETKLIELYLLICRLYDTRPVLKQQRLSNNHLLWEIVGNPVLLGIVSSIIGAFLYARAQSLIKYLQSRKGLLAGEWDQIIEDRNTKKIIKRDRVRCRNIGDKLWGTIERREPAEQNIKRWEFEARRRDAMIFGTYWSADLKNNESYGTIQHHVVDNRNLEGFYVKLEVQHQKRKHISKLKEVPFRWQKVA
jgi:hypothetical protein